MCPNTGPPCRGGKLPVVDEFPERGGGAAAAVRWVYSECSRRSAGFTLGEIGFEICELVADAFEGGINGVVFILPDVFAGVSLTVK